MPNATCARSPKTATIYAKCEASFIISFELHKIWFTLLHSGPFQTEVDKIQHMPRVWKIKIDLHLMLKMHLSGVYVKMRRKISFRSEWESVMLAVDDERQWQQMKCINRLPPSSSIFAFCLFSSSNSFHFMRMGEKSLSGSGEIAYLQLLWCS